MEVSTNCAAERKYRNIRPWLQKCIGITDDEAKSTPRVRLCSRKARRPDKNSNVVSFNSIPAVCFLPQYQYIATSEFATPNFPTCRVQIVGKDGALLNSFETEVERRGSSTFGLASAYDDDSSVAVCIGNGVGIWTVEGKLTSILTGKNVQNCCHITRMNNGLLATTCITEMRGRCVTLWDPKCGRVVSQFGSRPEIIEKNPLKATQKVVIRNNDIRLPWFLASNSRYEIMISDRNAKCIKSFDVRNRKFIRSFDTCGVDSRTRKALSPQGLCVDEDDNVIVVDSAKRSLNVFDRHGEFVKILSTEAEGTILGEPWAIAMTTSPQYHRPLCRSKAPGNDNARTLVYSAVTPDPILGVCKLSFCPHHTDYV